jgi:hypothetical protein
MGRITTDRLPTQTGYDAPGRLLIAGTVVLALGLGAVTASSASFSNDRGDIAQLRPSMVIDRGDAPCPHPSPEHPARPPAMLRSMAGESQGHRDFPRGTAIQSRALETDPAAGARRGPPRDHFRGEESTCPRSSGGSLVRISCADCNAASPDWDPVHDGLPRDRRTFLLDTAIQVHAPASAPAPRRSAPPQPHGVD